MNEQETRGAGSHGTWGDSSNCGSGGWSVYRWNNDAFVLEQNNCGGGASPVAPPQPTASQIQQMNAYAEFRAIVCCGTGSGSGSGSSS